MRKESLFLLCKGARAGFFSWAKRSYLRKEVSHGETTQIVLTLLLTQLSLFCWERRADQLRQGNSLNYRGLS